MPRVHEQHARACYRPMAMLPSLQPPLGGHARVDIACAPLCAPTVIAALPPETNPHTHTHPLPHTHAHTNEHTGIELNRCGGGSGRQCLSQHRCIAPRALERARARGAVPPAATHSVAPHHDT